MPADPELLGEDHYGARSSYVDAAREDANLPPPLMRIFGTLPQFDRLVRHGLAGAAGELACDPLRRVGLWSGRLEQDGL